MQNITTIQLIANSGSSQITQSGYLDITDETIIPITYSIGDVRDITKKNGSFSKSIKIKGTKNNNILLNHYFDVNESAGTFNIDVVQPCIVLQNGVPIFPNAVIQLISVDKKQDTNQYDEQTEYTLLIKDTAGDFFTLINNGYLEDLNLGLPNHTFNATAITSTFNYSYLQGYKYINSFNPSLSQGNAYNDTKYNIEEFKPAIYARSYWDSIFYNAGYSYNWGSIDDQTIQFNRLLIPFSNDEFKDDNLVSFFNVQAQSSGTTFATGIFQKKSQIFYTSQNYYESGSNKLIVVNNEIVDTGNNYNASASTYTNPDLPSNKNNITYTVTYTYNVSFINNESQTLFYAPFDWNNSHNFSVNGDLVIKPNVFVKDNNNTQYGKQQLINDIVIAKNTSFSAGTTIIKPSTTVTKKHVIDGISVPKNFTLNSKLDLGIINGTYGDSIITWRTAGNVTSDQYSLRLNITSVVVNIDANVMGDFGFNTTINFFDPIKQINPFAPKKIKQSDFIKGILTMFNLYTEIDINNPKQINIFRRDDYYDAGVTKDWSFKIDKEQNQELKFLPELTSKKLLLTYKQDSDFPNKTYFDATGEVYGQQEFTFDNQYVRGVDKKEILFSPTPMYNSLFGAVLPMMIGTAPATNIRILYDGGEKPCSAYTINNYSTTAGTVTTEHAITATTYSYANHWDTPVDPTYDLNFGICDYYYRTDAFGSPTNNTLFNSHWRRTLNLINNGKMLTAMFNLNEKDINELRLNDKIYINNSVWNINRVIDYDANSNNLTKVELFSIDDFLQLPFTERQHKFLTKTSPPYVNSINWLGEIRNPFVNWNGGTLFKINGMNNYVSPAVSGGMLIGSDNGLGGGTQFVMGSNNAISDDAFVYGSNNTIQSKSFIVGSSNSVETGNNIIMGSGNIIGSGVTDAFVIGNSITATTGNTLFTNNIILGSGGTVTIGDTVMNDSTLTMANASLSTGLYEFTNGGITITGNTFSIGAVKGWIINPADILNTSPSFVDYSGITASTTPYLLTAPATFFLVTSASTLFLMNTRPTMTDRRNMIYLGAIGHPNGNFTGAGNAPDIIMNELTQTRAMFEPTRLINDGVIVSPNSTDLTIRNSAGKLYGFGIGFIANGNNMPSILDIPAQMPTTFQYRTQTGQTFANTTTISADTYDLNGVATTIGGATNRATNQRIYLIQNGAIRIQFGQTIYSTLAEAISNASTEAFVTNINAVNFGILIGILSVRRSATNLSDTGDARFLQVSKFGESVGGSAGISTATLQSAYNNSVQPEIVTNSSLGGLSLIRGSASDTDNVFEIFNGASTLTARIDGNGSMTGTSFNSTVTGTSIPAINITMSGSNTGADFYNRSTGTALYVENTGSGKGAFIAIGSAGSAPYGLEISNGNSSTGNYGMRISSSQVNGKGMVINNSTTTTANPFEYTKNGVLQTWIQNSGAINSPNFIRVGGSISEYLLGDGSVGIRPKIYTALMAQTGTGNPTVNIVDNTLGGTIVWTRNSAGNYTGTLTGAFTSNKTICFTTAGIPFSASANQTLRLYRNDVNTVTLITIENGTLIDDALSIASIEIRIYP